MDGWASKRESWLKRRGVARSPPPLPLNARIPHIISPPACLPCFYPLSLSPPSLVLTFFTSLSSPSAPLPLPQVQHHQIVNYHSFISVLAPVSSPPPLIFPRFFPNLLALPPYRSRPPPCVLPHFYLKALALTLFPRWTRLLHKLTGSSARPLLFFLVPYIDTFCYLPCSDFSFYGEMPGVRPSPRLSTLFQRGFVLPGWWHGGD